MQFELQSFEKKVNFLLVSHLQSLLSLMHQTSYMQLCKRVMLQLLYTRRSSTKYTSLQPNAHTHTNYEQHTLIHKIYTRHLSAHCITSPAYQTNSRSCFLAMVFGNVMYRGSELQCLEGTAKWMQTAVTCSHLKEKKT